jgi:hypothetical protein
MAQMAQPYDPAFGDPVFREAMTIMVNDINGFVYAGDRLNAITDTITWLRAHPDVAAYLLTA